MNDMMNDYMGTIVIAKRREIGGIEFAFTRRGGDFRFVANLLLTRYHVPSQVSALFEPKEDKPPVGSGKRPPQITLDRELTWIASSERGIFRDLHAVNAVFLFDLDGKWYFVTPGPIHVKIPLELMVAQLYVGYGVKNFLWDVEARLLEVIKARFDHDERFREFLYCRCVNRAQLQAIREDISHLEAEEEFPLLWMRQKNRFLLGFFDDWAVVIPNEENTVIQDILLREWVDHREETICWVEAEE